MPSLPTRTQQPIPVAARVEIPAEFPDIPQEILDRFPSAKDWQTRLDDFWHRANQAIQDAQVQVARQVNSQVVYSVDSFRIYGPQGSQQPMFSLDGTGIRLGNVLVVATAKKTVHIGVGQYQNANTPFYVDTFGRFSLGANLSWDPATTTLAITGTITATAGSIGGFDIGADYIRDAPNSFGLASTVTGGDDVRFWAGATFANRANAPFRITESGVGVIGGFTIGATDLSANPSATSFFSMSSTGNIRMGQGAAGTSETSLDNNSLTIETISSAALSTVITRSSVLVSQTAGGLSVGISASAVTLIQTSGGLTTTLDVSSLNFGGDTNIYRSSANVLKTDDNFIAGAGIDSTNIGAGTPGTGRFTFLGVGTAVDASIPVLVSSNNSVLARYTRPSAGGQIEVSDGTNGGVLGFTVTGSLARFGHTSNPTSLTSDASGIIGIPSLAGVGSRAVLADAAGLLSAP